MRFAGAVVQKRAVWCSCRKCAESADDDLFRKFAVTAVVLTVAAERNDDAIARGGPPDFYVPSVSRHKKLGIRIYIRIVNVGFNYQSISPIP